MNSTPRPILKEIPSIFSQLSTLFSYLKFSNRILLSILIYQCLSLVLSVTFCREYVCVYVCILRARVQPTLDPYAEAFL